MADTPREPLRFPLPPLTGYAEFDPLHDDLAAWRDVVEVIGREHGGGPVEPLDDGTVLVARIGSERILKLYPPFLRDHFEFEHAMLQRMHGRLAVATPELIASGERDAWPYLVMSRLHGDLLTATWPAMDEARRCALLESIGALAAQAHALPVGEIARLAPAWPDFVRRQREHCLERQRRNGLAPQLLERLPDFIAGPLPEGPDVLLTGEYTPFNLFTRDHRLAAMFDFGDGLVGPREYDWLGPLCFLAAGHAPRVAAFFAGYGAPHGDRAPLLRLLMLHRYSNPPRQIKCEGWQQAARFEDVAAQIWP